MNSKFGIFTKGMAAGVAVGTAISMVTRPFDMRKRRHMKKSAEKALHAVGEIIQNAQSMMR